MFVLEVFETELTSGTDVPVMPFTEVVNVFAVLLLLTLFTAGAVTETPFTTDVMVLTALLNVCVVVAGAAVVAVQADPFQPNTCPLVGVNEAMALPINWFAFQYAPVLLMVAVFVAVVTAAVVVAVTVPILLLNWVQSDDEINPLIVDVAIGILKVCTEPDELILNPVPAVPVAKVCVEPVNPFIEVIALPANKFENVLVVTFPEASVVNNFVLMTLVPTPSNLTSRVTCSCAVGLLVPIPIFPIFLL